MSRGRRPLGDRPMTAAERQRRSRAARAATAPPKPRTAPDAQRIADLEAEIRRLSEAPKPAAETQEQVSALGVLPEAQAAQRIAELEAENAQLRDRVENLEKSAKARTTRVRNLELKLAVLRADRSALPENAAARIAGLVSHLGNENEHERANALSLLAKVLKEHGLNFTNISNRLRI